MRPHAPKFAPILALLFALAALAAAGCDDSDDKTSTAGEGSQSTPVAGDQAKDDQKSGEQKTGGGCWIELFDSDNFDTDDDHFELTKSGRYADLKKLPGADKDRTDEADSVRVGSSANVTVWEDENFKGQSTKLNPGSEHPSIDPEPSSIELCCDWSPQRN